MNSSLALTAGAPAEQVFTHEASLAEKPCVSQTERRTGEQPETSRLTSFSDSLASVTVGLCDHSQLRLVDRWSCPRCWNMNQSAGAAQHGRRYSLDEKVSTQSPGCCFTPHYVSCRLVWDWFTTLPKSHDCLHESHPWSFTFTSAKSLSC